MQYIQLQPQIASQVPSAATGTLNFFLDVETNNVNLKRDNGEILAYSTITAGTYSNSTLIFFDSQGESFSVTGITSGGGASLVSIPYSGLTNLINTNGLIPNSSYLITDFKTCYDTPEYYVNGNAKGSGEIDYRQGNVEPIIVLATSVNSISSTAYQPEYPKDRIQYDYDFSSTNTTSGVAYGRISERIDEYNNRTDYDHRNISFNRFQSYNKDSKLTGFLDSYNSGTGIVTGNGTLFSGEVSTNDVLLFDYQGPRGFKVVSIDSDTQLTVVVDPSFGSSINFTGGLIDLYKTTSTGNYDEYKEVYVGQKNEDDWDSYTTFNLNGGSIHNYVGDYSKFYLQEVGSTSGFMLANNVFYGNNIYSNTIGDRSYNNTGRYWFVRNTIAGRFYNNTINQSGFYSNNIGEYFSNNIIKDSVYTNTIAEGFNNNIIENNFYDNTIGVYFENNHTYSQFNKNIISNSCANNNIYSDFYENKIGLYFNENVIGDLGNLGNFNFYRNVIGNNFEQNFVRQGFQNNQIGNQFNENVVNGDFYKNVIGNGFNYNQNIGYNFYGNHIGNGFNNNDVIGDYFQNNQIGEYFENNNYISYNFKNNQIGNQFENNTLGNTDYFNWVNTSFENLTGRTYNSFYNSLIGDEGNNIGNIILGKELIMHDTTNDEYHKVKFTQWTQNNNGGGFSYERTKVYPTSGPTVYFTKLNYETKIDIIVEGSLEITRNNNGGIYNVTEENDWNQTFSPYGTEWNSIYTQNNTGANFEDNTISNQFKGNLILNEFQGNYVNPYVGSNQFSDSVYVNNIGSYTYDNQFLGIIADNTWQNNFYTNVIGDIFFGNTLGSSFGDNTIANGFQSNQIGNNFNSNTIGDGFGFGLGDPQGNKIGNNFSDNTINEYFYNNTIPDNFHNNTIGNYFQWNVVNTNINSTDFTSGYGNILGFTYVANGFTSVNGQTTGVSGTTNAAGIGALFTITTDSGSVIGVDMTNYGRLFLVNDTITVLGTQIGGATPDDNVVITITGVSQTPAFYEHYSKQIFERKNGGKRVSYYDENDILTIDSVFDASGYNFDVYSQDLTGILPINFVSFEFWCDGGFIAQGGITNKTVTNMSELVEEFNSNINTNKYGLFFDNGDGTLGLTINKFYKDVICPRYTITLNVFND